FADATSVSGARVGLGNGASIFDVKVSVLKLGRGAIVRGTEQPFQGGAAACAFAAMPCGGQNGSLRRGDSPRVLTPGTYNSVSLETGTSLTLSPGTYSFCELHTDKQVNVQVIGAAQSTITVAGEVALENDTTFGPAAGTPTPLLNVGGDLVRFA